jgi:hypothetical protein
MAGPVFVHGTLAPGVEGIGRLTVSNSLTLTGGAVFEINRFLSPSNDQVIVTGTLGGGGTLTVNNLGGQLEAGDTFTLFSRPVTGFAGVTLPLLPPWQTWTNRLALDGSIAVVAVATGPATTPHPANGAIQVALNPVLNWTPGINASSHRVYFGFSSNAVAGATTNSPEFQGAFASASYSPGTLASSGRFYWRVDEVGPTLAAGPVWTFATVIDPAAAFPISGTMSGGFAVGFPSQLGQTYRVERSDGLVPADWQTVSNSIPGTGGWTVIHDPAGVLSTQRFYRALILPP